MRPASLSVMVPPCKAARGRARTPKAVAKRKGRLEGISSGPSRFLPLTCKSRSTSKKASREVRHSTFGFRHFPIRVIRSIRGSVIKVCAFLCPRNTRKTLKFRSDIRITFACFELSGYGGCFVGNLALSATSFYRRPRPDRCAKLLRAGQRRKRRKRRVEQGAKG